MIYQILKQYGARGKENAMTMEQLKPLTGKSEREITKAVQDERKRHLICSKTTNGGGYYRPANKAEITEYIQLQEGRIAQHAVSLRLARRFKKRQQKHNKVAS